MSTPERILGSDPLDAIRVTLSRRLRRILFEAGLVASPELPLYDARPERPAPTPTGTDGACLSSRAQAPQRDSRAGAPSYPGSTATVVPPTALASAQAARGGRPAHESAARAASPDTTSAPAAGREAAR